MNQSKKERTHRKKVSAERHVGPEEKATTRRDVLLVRLTSRSRRDFIKASAVAILFIALVGAIPMPHTFAKSAAVDFTTDNQKSAGLELGDTKVLQEGSNGVKVVNIKSLQSIWGRLLGLQPIQQKEVSQTIVEKPVSRIVADGSRKYQYMLCTNGGYRYYTDEQFRNPNTGFTSKSEDNCRINNQGTKLKLADSPDGTVNNHAPPSVTSRAPVAPGCKETPVPYGTEYQNASYLPRGTQQVASQGMNGFILRCPGSADIKISGVNQLVLVGTGKTAAEIQAENDAAEVARQQEEAARDQRYYLALANCVQSLRAQGMTQASAESNCRSIIQR